MNHKEKYDVKRRNFIEKTKVYFQYLIDSFQYSEPIHDFGTQSNGVVLFDKITYVNKKRDRMIILYNAYHPIDYGFEVQCYRPSVSIDRNSMLKPYYVLKEDQDIEQSYLRRIALAFKQVWRHNIRKTMEKNSN